MPELVTVPYLFPQLETTPWWSALTELDEALRQSQGSPDVHCRLRRNYRKLVSELIGAGHASLAAAISDQLLFAKTLLPAGGEAAALPAGVRAAAELDLQQFQLISRRDWHAAAEGALGGELPPLEQLAPLGSQHSALVGLLTAGDAAGLLTNLLQHYRRHGQGNLARYRAFRWSGGLLDGVARPASADWAELEGLERQLGQLEREVNAFLADRPAQNTLLYGPRGSGKSTAVRGLLQRYAESGLRLIEVPAAELGSLPELLPQLSGSPLHFVLFVDDLGFEVDDGSFQPLKTLLEGTLAAPPGNTLLIATSNRRHLLKQRFSDRPDPLNDDVHAWDTQQQQLALPDRFGRVITFPATDQRRYLELVAVLASRAGLDLPDLHERALAHAEWGNGYSGRTARQFIDTCLQERPAGEVRS